MSLKSGAFAPTAGAESLENHRHVVAHVDETDGAIGERGASVAVQVDGDHLAMSPERPEVGLEHVDRSESAVQQEQRLALAVDLVVVVDAARGGVAFLEWHELPRRFRLSLRDARCDDERERGCESL